MTNWIGIGVVIVAVIFFIWLILAARAECKRYGWKANK